ncbi:MAG: YifB family Mg chelatase-like AAA ATPase [Deltaproteobacteria bacterium]|nr:YifB family Mg chelatase-like AAA ATPase [Deltaproteobacteria bacterium]
MLAATHASTLVGLEAHPVQVEVDIARGLPAFDLVGLPEASVRESRMRVRSALEQVGFLIPTRRVTVNLAPADLRKYGAGFDLAIAVATLAAARECPEEILERWMLIGELSLNGNLRPVRGVLAMVLCARKQGFLGVVVPAENAAEAAVVSGLSVRAARSLSEVIAFLRGEYELPTAERVSSAPNESEVVDLSDIRGQHAARRALEIAAAGAHNVLFMGPPGGGKTLLAKAMPGILPPLTFDEAIEVTSVYSVAGMLRGGVSLVERRPFRAPHHTASTVGLVGGGDPPRPGEIALAHHGVLFLDELPEFSRDSLEALREPLEDGSVTIVRSRVRSTFPARFTLVAAMNPCPCGYQGDPSDRCDCSAERVKRYRSRVSGPLLDRIDLCVHLPGSPAMVYGEAPDGPSSQSVRTHVSAARDRQMQREANQRAPNARLTPRALRAVAALEPDARGLVTLAAERMGLSARAMTRVLRVSRTIADLEGESSVSAVHVAEAVGYRSMAQG